MNSEQSAQLGRAATLTLVALCVGGAVSAYHLAVRPTLIVAIGAVFAISLISGAVYLIVEALGRRHLTLERRADARLASAIAGLHAGIALFDENDRLVVTNPTYCQVHEIIADILLPGVPFETILRENVKRSRFDLGVDEAEAYIARRLDQHRNPGPVVERRLNDGHWEQVREERLRDGGLLLVILDITDQKAHEVALLEAKTAAEAANRAKTDFLSTMSHDLRTPLNAIIGFSDLMMTGVFGPIGSPKYLEYAEDIHRSGGLLLDMINDLLDLSKIEAGRYELYPENIDVAAVAAECEIIVGINAEHAGVRLTFAVGDVPMVHADDRAFKQILLNLLSNAIKYTPPGGSVSIAATVTSDDMVAIEVVDTGIGIASDDLNRVFEPFRRGDTSVARTHEGTGLGLAITKRLVELSGGKLCLESEVGLGTSVKVWLPATPPDALAANDRVRA